MKEIILTRTQTLYTEQIVSTLADDHLSEEAIDNIVANMFATLDQLDSDWQEINRRAEADPEQMNFEARARARCECVDCEEKRK